MPIETITLSEQGKDHLVKLKRWTGVMNWNVLCRWSFCTSLAEPSVPPATRIPSDSSVEMSWETFAGDAGDIYWALLVERCRRDKLGTTPEVLAQQFRLHLHRGIGYLAADRQIRNVGALLARAVRPVPVSA